MDVFLKTVREVNQMKSVPTALWQNAVVKLSKTSQKPSDSLKNAISKTKTVSKTVFL